MTRLEALKALEEKIDAGTLGAGICGPLCGSAELPAHSVIGAYNGWIDKANDLHDAVLPRWMWSKTGLGLVRVFYDGPWFSGESENVARAWLLAIIRALIAEEEG